jgi:hypothetical protein
MVAGGTCLPAAARLFFIVFSIFWLVAGGTCLLAAARLVFDFEFFAFFCPFAGFRLGLVAGPCQLLSVGHVSLCFFFFVAAAFPET